MVVFATDEPIDVQAAEGSTILVRRMKQGVAEYFKYQLKAQMWEGLRQYVIGGWNTGPAPYGYQPERSTHPNPIKANMGATRARLVPDPETGPRVTRIYEWRVYEKLSRPAIARQLGPGRRAVPGRQGMGPQRRRPHPEEPEVHRPGGTRPHPQHRHQPAQGRTQSPRRPPRLLDLGR